MQKAIFPSQIWTEISTNKLHRVYDNTTENVYLYLLENKEVKTKVSKEEMRKNYKFLINGK